MTRPILVIHRYVGVVLGVLMTLWCLSGFVMMYQPFPDATSKERLAGLEPLSASGCCIVPAAGLADDAKVSAFRIEMLGGTPVLRLRPAEGRPGVYSLATGEAISAASHDQLLRSVEGFGRGLGLTAKAADAGIFDIDQWTVATAKGHRPAHRFRFDDPGRTDVYVDGKTGEVFQHTNAKERFWSWLGPIPHWIYPTALRQYPKTWGQLIIWTSAIGTFLTITGLWVGIVRLRRLPGGRISPFKGVWFWHHMTGLVFGVLTMTWVFSGLLTMDPGDMLFGNPSGAGDRVSGEATFLDVKRAVAALPKLADGSIVQITAVPLGGRTALVAAKAKGQRTRFGADGAAMPLSNQEVAAALEGQKVASLEVLHKEDAYYYGHPDPVDLPVYRAVLADDQKTRLYIDATTGRIVRQADKGARTARWLQSALHDFDWPGLRARPVWDLVTLPLLAGVTVLCAIGAWLGFERIGRDVNLLRVQWRRRKTRAAKA